MSSPYAPAARLLGTIWESKKSLKSLAYDKQGNLLISKSTYAQVCHVLADKAHLDHILSAVSLENCRNEGLLYILLYELLLGPNKKIRGGGALKRQLIQQEDALRQAAMQFIPTTETINNNTTNMPRYVRVNTMKTTLSQVVKLIRQEHATMDIYLDPHVPNLLVLPPKTILPTLVQQGLVVLQDKSSCFSALLLAQFLLQHDSGDALDACAAPGNKTSHLCMLLNDSSSTTTSSTTTKRIVFACDRNKIRLETLKRRLTPLLPTSSPDVLLAKCIDFLTTQPADYPTVRGILLDPSCSGSGMMMQPHQQDKSRITTLSNFQSTCLKHAMSFPQVQYIVYSTCSIYDEENESVVRHVLTQQQEWQLVMAPLPTWHRRGTVVDGLSQEQADCMIRTNGNEDSTNGFFVACLTRVGSDKSPPPPMVEAMAGLEFYNGQFAAVVLLPPTKPIKKKEPFLEKPLTKTAPPKSALKPAPAKKNIVPKAVVVKKAAKKQAWKQKQMELKKNRLLTAANNKKAMDK